MGDRLLWGVKNGDVPAVKEEIDKGFDVNKELLNGRNALHYAADYGQVDVIQILVSKGANVNLPDKYGITPILAAIWEGHEEAVRFLLKEGAKKTGKSPEGQSYLDCAETDTMKALLQ